MTATLAPSSATTVSAHVPEADPRGLRTLVADTLVFTRRHLEHIRQIPEKLLDVTAQPLMFVLLFSYVFGGAINTGAGSYREFLIGGILIQTLCFGMAGPAMSIATDLTEGVVDRFRSLPARRASYLLGHFLAEFAGLIVAVTILCGAGLAVGWRTHASIVSVVGAFGLLLLFSAAMVWMGTWLGMVVRSADSVMGMLFTLVFPMTFMSNAFVPIQSMPTWLQHVASWNPVSVMVAATRSLFGNPQAPLVQHTWPMEHAPLAATLICAVLLVATIPLALRRYQVRTTG